LCVVWSAEPAGAVVLTGQRNDQPALVLFPPQGPKCPRCEGPLSVGKTMCDECWEDEIEEDAMEEVPL
jgi:hypothetical protein